MAGNLGMKVRKTRMMDIVKGSELVTGSKQTTAQKFNSAVKFFSGEPMVLKATGTGTAGQYVDADLEWAKIDASFATTPTPVYWAFTDSDSFDVQASHKLLGISVLDTFELRTPFYDTNVAQYNPGDALTVKAGIMCAEDGNPIPEYKAVSGTSAPSGFTQVSDYGTVGVVTKAAEGDPIVGYVTLGEVQCQGDQPMAMGSASFPNNQGSGAAIDNSVITGGPRVYTEATNTHYVLQFSTHYSVPSKADAGA